MTSTRPTLGVFRRGPRPALPLRLKERCYDTILLCPVCGYECTHLDTAKVSPSRIALQGYCESGHAFALTFTQHKGDTLIECVRLPDLVFGPAGYET